MVFYQLKEVMVIGKWIFQQTNELIYFYIIIGGSEPHQSATDFSADPRGGKA